MSITNDNIGPNINKTAPIEESAAYLFLYRIFRPLSYLSLQTDAGCIFRLFCCPIKQFEMETDCYHDEIVVKYEMSHWG